MMNQRGYTELSVTKIFLFLLFAFAILGFIEFAQGFFEQTKIEGKMTEIILTNRTEMNDSVLIDSIATRLQADVGVKVDPANISVLRSTDQSKVTVEAKYVRPLTIPFYGKVTDVTHNAKVEENLTLKH